MIINRHLLVTILAVFVPNKCSCEERLSEVVSTTPVITRKNEPKAISKNAMTVKDVTEADMSTSIGGISVVEVYLLLCEGQKKTMACPNNDIIEIVSASYGYNGSSTSAREECDSIWPWANGDDDTRCYEQRSGEILTTKCGESSQCEVFASNEVFGNPCRGIRKFLEVFYYCRAEPLSEFVSSTSAITRNHDSETISTNTMTAKDVTEAEISTSISGISTVTTDVEVYLLLCEGEKETIACPNNATIEIVSASYGYNGSSTSAREECDSIWPWANGDDDTSCHEQRSGEILTTKCGGSSECVVFASNEDFGNPCQGTTKFLELFYYCGAEPLSEFVSSTSAITRNHDSETISTNTMTAKDVTEAEISTSISGISTVTTDVEVYLLLCEDQKKTIACPNHAIIEIVSASYGYNGSSTSAREECDPLAWYWERGDDNTICHEQRSGEILTTKCGRSSECDVSASNEVFGDPCSGTKKFLKVFYYCRAGKSFN